MNKELLAKDLPEINYGIREIVQKGKEMEDAGFTVRWENIGDPVHKGLMMPQWMKEIISKTINQNESFAYCDSKGMLSTRTFLADKTNQLGGVQIGPEDITFFNGLGDAINTLYRLFSPDMKVLQPSPTYPAHTSAERIRIHEEPATYTCDLQNGGCINIQEIREKVASDRRIRAILVINPDNPTGTVHPKEDLMALVEVAKEFGLLMIADEIYEKVVYEGTMTTLAEVIGPDVRGIAMKGISKEFPWPGARCGWIEVYNRTLDEEFREFCKRIDKVKMSEVCCTTLPQTVIPEVMTDYRYPGLLAERNAFYRRRMERVKEIFLHSSTDVDVHSCFEGSGTRDYYDLKSYSIRGTSNDLGTSGMSGSLCSSDISGSLGTLGTSGKQGMSGTSGTPFETTDPVSWSVSKGGGGFYAVFTLEGLDSSSFTKASIPDERRHLFNRWTEGVSCVQTKLSAYLLAVAGVCVVPLSAFQSDQIGFRMTLLETSDLVFDEILFGLKRSLEGLMKGEVPHNSHGFIRRSYRQELQSAPTI